MEEAKYDEKVEKSEQEKRCKNFIIHGADEYEEKVNMIRKLTTIM